MTDIYILVAVIATTNIIWYLFCTSLLKSNRDLTDKLMARNLPELIYNRQVEAVVEKNKKEAKSVESPLTRQIEALREEPEIIGGENGKSN